MKFFRASRIGLALAAEFEDDALLPRVRVGLSAGPVVLREGDYHGPVVNLAARIVKMAEPGTVLAPSAFQATVAGLTFDDAGIRDLKGIGERVELIRVR